MNKSVEETPGVVKSETRVKKQNLLNLNRQGMREYFASIGEKPFRADQVMKWIYQEGHILNLKESLKERLLAGYQQSSSFIFFIRSVKI